MYILLYVHRGREVMAYDRKRCVSCAWDGHFCLWLPPKVHLSFLALTFPRLVTLDFVLKIKGKV